MPVESSPTVSYYFAQGRFSELVHAQKINKRIFDIQIGSLIVMLYKNAEKYFLFCYIELQMEKE